MTVNLINRELFSGDIPDRIYPVMEQVAKFLERHPDFPDTAENRKAVIGELTKKHRKINADNLHAAYLDLKKRGTLERTAASLYYESAEEQLAFAKEHGTPVKDWRGKIIGYNFGTPEELSQAAEDRLAAQKDKGREPSVMTRDCRREDKDRMPSARELATWDADRLREHAVYHGYWNKDFPQEVK